MDVNRIICKLCRGLYQNSIRALYHVDCGDSFCPRSYAAAIFALESGCDITSDLRCQIEALTTPSITSGSGDQTLTCNITLTGTVSSSSCTTILLTRRI